MLERTWTLVYPCLSWLASRETQVRRVPRKEQGRWEPHTIVYWPAMQGTWQTRTPPAALLMLPSLAVYSTCPGRPLDITPRSGAVCMYGPYQYHLGTLFVYVGINCIATYVLHCLNKTILKDITHKKDLGKYHWSDERVILQENSYELFLTSILLSVWTNIPVWW